MSEKHQPGFMPWDRTSNKLLVQAQLGKTKGSDYNLPDKEFMYGNSTPRNPQDIDLLLYKWKYSDNLHHSNTGMEKDFIRANKDCIRNMLVTAKDQYNFRKTGQSYMSAKEGSKYMKIKLPNSLFSYGKPLVTEDPIHLLLANQYGEIDKHFRHSQYLSETDRNNTNRKRKLSFHKTKNVILLKDAALKRRDSFNWDNRQQNEWKLGKFSQVSAKVQPPNTKKSGDDYFPMNYIVHRKAQVTY